MFLVRCGIHALYFHNLYIFSCQFPPSSVSLSVSDYLQMRKIYSEKPPFCPLQIYLFHSYFALCGGCKSANGGTF